MHLTPTTHLPHTLLASAEEKGWPPVRSCHRPSKAWCVWGWSRLRRTRLMRPSTSLIWPGIAQTSLIKRMIPKESKRGVFSRSQRLAQIRTCGPVPSARGRFSGRIACVCANAARPRPCLSDLRSAPSPPARRRDRQFDTSSDPRAYFWIGVYRRAFCLICPSPPGDERSRSAANTIPRDTDWRGRWQTPLLARFATLIYGDTSVSPLKLSLKCARWKAVEKVLRSLPIGDGVLLG